MKDLFYLSGIVINIAVGAFCLSILAETFDVQPVQVTKDLIEQAREELSRAPAEDDTIPYPKQ